VGEVGDLESTLVLLRLDAKIFKKFDDCRLQNKERNSAVRRIKIFQIWIGKSS